VAGLALRAFVAGKVFVTANKVDISLIDDRGPLARCTMQSLAASAMAELGVQRSVAVDLVQDTAAMTCAFQHRVESLVLAIRRLCAPTHERGMMYVTTDVHIISDDCPNAERSAGDSQSRAPRNVEGRAILIPGPPDPLLGPSAVLTAARGLARHVQAYSAE